MSLGTGTRLGPYELISLIGAGGMGEVYRAKDTPLDRAVANNWKARQPEPIFLLWEHDLLVWIVRNPERHESPS